MSDSESTSGDFRNRTYPWRDEDLMRQLYEEELRSTVDIAELFGCSPTTVAEWAEKHPSIEKRTRGEGIQAALGILTHASFLTREFGHEVWQHDKNTVLVHRLLAVAEYGLDELRGSVVHHKNNIPWDNRPENLELMELGEHSSHHNRKIRGEDRKRVADIYEHTDRSSRDVADQFDVCNNTVLDIHEEFYGEGSAARSGQETLEDFA